ncbi:MAG TPA: hypothetical protein VFI89_02630, partial [Burkholderiales bacterium]|nr:hypothetical protein [Burkholderiales bacterium]
MWQVTGFTMPARADTCAQARSAATPRRAFVGHGELEDILGKVNGHGSRVDPITAHGRAIEFG